MLTCLCFGSQELLEAVERERNIRATPVRNTAVFHHPALGNFELQHVGFSSNFYAFSSFDDIGIIQDDVFSKCSYLLVLIIPSLKSE